MAGLARWALQGKPVCRVCASFLELSEIVYLYELIHSPSKEEVDAIRYQMVLRAMAVLTGSDDIQPKLPDGWKKTLARRILSAGLRIGRR